jgi:hypothetical protein
MSITSANNHHNIHNKWPAIAATGIAGVITGCLTFVSAVDARSFLAHVKGDQKNNNTDIIQRHFPIWWPNGRDLMVPLIAASTLCHGWAYYSYSYSTKSTTTSTTSNNTNITHPNNLNWAISGLLLMLIGPYTAVVLGEDIETLRKADSTEVEETTKRFCRLHHVRLVLAVAGFGLSLFGLAEL